ncbi:MAG: alpha/beta fold hydrolase [Firmicutes bacterium]|nr:alpha/beta fold hydrolase [Bacillota bacterium]
MRQLGPENAAAGLVFLHGSMVHSEYYLAWALDLAQHGILVSLPDLRGHGRSAGPRGTILRYEEHVADVARVIHAVRERHPDLPLYLGGESYGALIAFLASASPELARQIAGLVLASPAFGLQAEISPRLRQAIRWASGVLPFLRPVRPMPFEGVTHNPDAAPLVYADRLVVRRYTLRFLAELLRAQEAAYDAAAAISRPVLAFLAEEDRIVDNRAAEAVLSRLNSPMTRLLLKGAWHAVTVESPGVLTEHFLRFTVQAAQDMTALRIERAPEFLPLTTPWMSPRAF